MAFTPRDFSQILLKTKELVESVSCAVFFLSSSFISSFIHLFIYFYFFIFRSLFIIHLFVYLFIPYLFFIN